MKCKERPRKEEYKPTNSFGLSRRSPRCYRRFLAGRKSWIFDRADGRRRYVRTRKWRQSERDGKTGTPLVSDEERKVCRIDIREVAESSADDDGGTLALLPLPTIKRPASSASFSASALSYAERCSSHTPRSRSPRFCGSASGYSSGDRAAAVVVAITWW